MNKGKTFLLALFLLAVLANGGVLCCKKGVRSEDFPWVTIDENYTPQNYIEQFIKADSEQKGIFPVYIKNYGKNRDILRKFRGSRFAGANEAALNLAFSGLEDWMLIDLKYKNEKDQEVLRTVLYIQLRGTWRVGDSGQVQK